MLQVTITINFSLRTLKTSNQTLPIKVENIENLLTPHLE